MKDLISLVEVVSKNKIKEIEVIGSANHKETNVQKLYSGIHNGSIISDQDVIDNFFPNNKNANLYSSRLKGQLKERLINTLFFIDLNQNNFNDYLRAYYTCYKMSAATRILLGRGARTAATPIAEKALDMALQFDLTDVAFLLAKDLRMHYGTMRSARQRYEEISQILEEQTKVLMAELKAEEYLNNLRVNFNEIKASKPEFAEKAQAYVDELLELSKHIHSYRFNYMVFAIRTIRYEVVGNYKEMLMVSTEALDYFSTKEKIVPNTVIFSFQVRRLVCLMQLKEYEKAKEIFPQCVILTQEGAHNWFLLHNYQMILAFHAGDFQEAYEVGKKALDHPKLKNQNEQTIEFWHIHEAYLFYLLSIKKIKPENNNPVQKFRVSKFINEVPIFRKDKRGANITIVVLQILFLLDQKKYEVIIDRIESLKTYTQRYLRNDDTFRSNCFIRMLVVMAESSFNKKATIRKAEKHWEKLKEKPINIAEQSAEIEIVPYEMLWEFILESLDEKWH
jgi:tetratricopeptide (TPR) repeat protein